jgi:general secretion pathway protein G
MNRLAKARTNKGFTLVEILIVVIILGILAAIVIPQFTNASQDARKSSLTSQLQTLRSQISLYALQHSDQYPSGLTGTATDSPTIWKELLTKTNADHTTTGTPVFGPYLQTAPINSLNNSSTIQRVTVDVAFQAAATAGVGWVFNTANGKIWATSKTGAFIYDESNSAAAKNDQ